MPDGGAIGTMADGETRPERRRLRHRGGRNVRRDGLRVQDFTIGAGDPATRTGTSANFAPFDYAYVTRPRPPSIGAFEP